MTIELSLAELRTIANALNEVCNGIDIADAEFQTRLGVDRVAALAVLKKVCSALEISN